MRGEIIEFFIIKQVKKPRLVLCSVVKHLLGSSRALKKWGKTLDCVSCFPLHFFRALPLPACFTTEHSTVEASLFVKYNTLHYLYYSHYLQHSIILHFLSLLHTLNEKKSLKKGKKTKKQKTTYYICTLIKYNKTKVTKILVLVDLLTFNKPLK